MNSQNLRHTYDILTKHEPHQNNLLRAAAKRRVIILRRSLLEQHVRRHWAKWEQQQRKARQEFRLLFGRV